MYVTVASTTPPLQKLVTYVRSTFLLKNTPLKWRTPLHLIIQTSYVFVQPFINSTFLHTLSIKVNPVCTNSISCCMRQYMYSHTCVRASSCFSSPNDKAKIFYNTHSRFFINAFYQEWSFVHSQKFTSSHQENNFCKTFPDSNHHFQCLYF